MGYGEGMAGVGTTMIDQLSVAVGVSAMGQSAGSYPRKRGRDSLHLTDKQ